MTTHVWPDEQIVRDLAQFRRVAPLTHCITNIVVTGFTANVLLALGASPAMVIAPEEAGEFSPIAQALLINVGTVTQIDALAMTKAAAAAQKAGTPWVLDPVAVGVLEFRTQIAVDLLKYRPAVIKGNASEIMALAGSTGGGKGVDSAASSTEALPQAQALASRTESVVAVTGEVDYVTDGVQTVCIPGGDVLMTKVTGTGCALGAVMAAFLAVCESPMQAAIAGSAVFSEAAQQAARLSSGPGSFASCFLDRLYLIGK